jgi:hypothetical protein
MVAGADLTYGTALLLHVVILSVVFTSRYGAQFAICEWW